MKGDDAAVAVIDALETLGAPYMIVGSLSSNYYGEARSTRDADFVVDMHLDRINDLASLLGPAFHLDRQLGFETVDVTQRYRFEIEGTRFKIEVFFLGNKPYERMRFERRRRVKIGDRESWLPTAEDVIVQKLWWAKRANRKKDIVDVENVVDVMGADALDWPYIEKWCAHFQVMDLLNEVRGGSTG